MNTTLEQIQPETLARVAKHAALNGLSIDEYLRELLLKNDPDLVFPTDAKDGDFENERIACAEGAENLP